MSEPKATMAVIGTTPDGARDERSAAQTVRKMFDEIAPRYDLANDVLSGGVDRLWWWRAARTFRHILVRPESEILDLCCGTGAMSVALHKRRPANGKSMVAADFSHQMLKRGLERFRKRGILPVEADALNLPFSSGRFQLVVSAFGFRNLANYNAGLAEIFRVLAPGGEIGILDFSEPKGVLGVMYRQYFRHVLPRLGALISGKRTPYEYLPSSVGKFPSPDEMLERMKEVGFQQVRWTAYNLGIAGLYRGVKG